MNRTILDFTPDGLKRRLADMERQLADIQRRGEWNFDSGELDPETILAASGFGQLLIVAASADSIASGGDYVSFGSLVHQQGFDDVTFTAGAQSFTWPFDSVGYVQVEMAWDSYTGGGTVEIEVDGTVPAWGLIGQSSSGQYGCKRRGVVISEGSTVKIKVTQTSGSAQTADVLVEMGMQDPTNTAPVEASVGFPVEITPGIATTTGGGTFFDETFRVFWDGAGPVKLSLNSDGTGAYNVDDRLTMDVTPDTGSLSTFTSDGGAGPVDVSGYFAYGWNTVRVRLSDTVPSTIGSSPIWLVQV